MKRLLVFIICVFTFTTSSFAQTTDTFDIATFTPPVGWKKEAKDGVVMFTTTDEKKGTFCVLSVYGSGESSGDPKRDFENDWQEFIAGPFKVTEKPEVETAKTAGGWDSVTGGAAFQSELGPSVVVLNTFSGYGKAFSLAGVFNDRGYLPAIERFVASFKLETAAPTNSPSPSAGTNDASIVGMWGASGSTQNTYAVNHGLAGYIQKEYTFSANGTYQFLVKTFQYTMTNLIFRKETGTYQISGDRLTLIPQKGYIQAWTKGTVIESSGKRSQTDKWGTLVSTQATKLEKVTYQIKKHYFSGIDQWQLVMRASQPTDRDGPFTTNADFPNSWLYGTQRFPIEPPR